MKKLTLLLLLIIPCLAIAQPDGEVEGYTVKNIEGRSVYVQNIALSEHPKETQAAVDLLKTQLQQVDKMNMSSRAKSKLRTVPFFLDWSKRPNGGAEYHPSRQWLVDNDFIAEKAKTINITNIVNFVNWSNQNQPYVVLHELTHAYHDQVLGYNNADVQNAYDDAIRTKIYESVLYHIGDGRKTIKNKAYATNNVQEYFAELTEAYFGENDYYPFNKSDLKRHDPKGYAMIQKVWQDGVEIVEVEEVVAKFNPNKYYRLTTQWQGEGKSLDVVNDGKNNNKLQLANTGRQSGQFWKIEDLGNGYYRLTTQWQGEGKSLDVVNDGKNNNKLQLANTGRQSGQFWKIEDLGSGYYRLTTQWQGEGKSLDVVNDGKNNNQLQLANTGRQSGQFWKITEVK